MVSSKFPSTFVGHVLILNVNLVNDAAIKVACGIGADQ